LSSNYVNPPPQGKPFHPLFGYGFAVLALLIMPAFKPHSTSPSPPHENGRDSNDIPDALLHCGQQYAQSGLLRRADAQSRPAFQNKTPEFPASGQGISLRISDTLKPCGKTKKSQI
jgi:hypothetical protein